MSSKKLCLVRYQVLGLLVNMMTANYEFSCSNRENLPLPIQINLSKKPSTFTCIFLGLFESKLSFQCSEKKMSPIGQVSLKLLTPKDKFISMHNRACF